MYLDNGNIYPHINSELKYMAQIFDTSTEVSPCPLNMSITKSEVITNGRYMVCYISVLLYYELMLSGKKIIKYGH